MRPLKKIKPELADLGIVVIHGIGNIPEKRMVTNIARGLEETSQKKLSDLASETSTAQFELKASGKRLREILVHYVGEDHKARVK